MADPKTQDAEPESAIKPAIAVANKAPGGVQMSEPEEVRNADLECHSVIHDRPFVRLAPKGAGKKGAEALEEVIDLHDKPKEFFHPGGKCSCQDPRDPQPVSLEARAKQLVRIARRDPQAFLK